MSCRSRQRRRRRSWATPPSPPRPPRRHQADVDVAEIIVLERFDLQGAVAIGHFDAHAAARRQRHHLVSREFAFVENVEHFPPDTAGRYDQRDFVTHGSLSEEKCLAPRQLRKRRRQRFYARNALKTTLDPRPPSVLGHAWGV